MRSKEKIKVAIVLTCFNRVEKTERALTTLLSSAPDYDYHIFLCDDGSTDGTGYRISSIIQNVEIIKGNGQLFWARGMAVALKSAERIDPDFYLMINDDVEFKNNAISIMFDAYFSLNDCYCAVTGATQDGNGDCSYGGSYKNALNDRWVRPSMPMKECELANWNCFLISKDLYNMVGKIDDYYEHSYADYDYSNRIYLSGGRIFVASEYIGYCERNSIIGTWMDRSLSVRERIKRLHKRNGLPIKSQIHYYRKFEKQKWFLFVVKPYLIILKDICKKRKKQL